MLKLLCLATLFSSVLATPGFSFNKILPCSAATHKVNLHQYNRYFSTKNTGPAKLKRGDLSPLKKQAEQGNIHAQYMLGKHFMAQDPSVKDNRYNTKHWLKKAFKGGTRQAGFELGLYFLSQGPSKHGEAIKFLTSAADNGEPFAQYLLGTIYENGILVEKDAQRGTELMAEAGKQGIDWESYIMVEQELLRKE